MSPITSPYFTYPFKSAIGPYAAAVDNSVFEWGKRQGLYSTATLDGYHVIGIGELVSRAYPLASDEEQVLIGMWILWLFTFDDYYCDESECGFAPDQIIRIVSRFLGILDGRPHGAIEDSLDTALADFMRRLTAHATAAQRARFVYAVSNFFHGICWEAVNRAHLLHPDLTAYQHMRFHSGGVPTCIALIEIANNFELSDEEYYHPEVGELITATSNIVGWSNDILSLPKENARSRVVHNLPTILQFHRKLAISEAIDQAITIHNDEVTVYIRTEERVRRWASGNLRRFLDGLHYWITGNLEWSLICGRYGIADSSNMVGHATEDNSPSVRTLAMLNHRMHVSSL
jgi:hypothetical protein